MDVVVTGAVAAPPGVIAARMPAPPLPPAPMPPPYYHDVGRDRFTSVAENAFKLVREEPVSTIVAAGFDRDTVVRIERLLHIAEYKRRQAAPGVKVTLKNFGRDRRYPITNRFRDPGTPLPAPNASPVAGKPVRSEAADV